MKPDDLVRCLREAGAVERCHTLPHCGSYTVGQHSFDAVSLLLVLHPNPSLDLIKAVLWHDVAERWTGDVPAVAKWDDPELSRLLVALEERVFQKLGVQSPNNLSEQDHQWLEAVDKLELWLWAKGQLRMGNQNAAIVFRNLEPWFERTEVPPAVLQLMCNYEEKRDDGLLRSA